MAETSEMQCGEVQEQLEQEQVAQEQVAQEQAPQKPRAKDQSRDKRLSAAADAHSIHDEQAFAEFADASPEDRAEYSDALASFDTWMQAGPAKKSAKNYTGQVRMCMMYHGKTIDAMGSDGYFAKVKTSGENFRRNSIISAGVKKFREFLEARGRTTGPWEVRALPGESIYRVESVGQKAAPPPPPKPADAVLAKQAMAALFASPAAKPKPPAVEKEANEQAETASNAVATKEPEMQEQATSARARAKATRAADGGSPALATREPGSAEGSPSTAARAKGRPGRPRKQKAAQADEEAAAATGCQKPKKQKSAKTDEDPSAPVEVKTPPAKRKKPMASTELEAAPDEAASLNQEDGKPAVRGKRSLSMKGTPRSSTEANGAAKAKTARKAIAGDEVAAVTTPEKVEKVEAAKQGGKKALTEDQKKVLGSRRIRALKKRGSSEGREPGAKAKVLTDDQKKVIERRRAQAKKKAEKAEKAAKEQEASPNEAASPDKPSKKDLGREHQMADLLKAIRAASRMKDFQRAEQRYQVLKAFCEDNGIPVPTSLKEPSKDGKKNNEVQEDVDVPDEMPRGDPIAVARDVLRRCFGLKFPVQKPAAEDDSDVRPAKKAEKKLTGRKALDGADAANVAALSAQAEELAAAFAGLQEAQNQDYIRLHAVGAAFRAFRAAKGSEEEAKSDDYVKTFYELFQLDDKSFDAMASDQYHSLVNQSDKVQGQVVAAFQEFWKVKGKCDIEAPPPRLPTSEERRLAAEVGLPPGWRVQVYHRVKREDLVVLTSPDGAHDFMSKEGLKAMAEADSNFAEQRQKAEALQASGSMRPEEAQRLAAAMLDRRRRYYEERMAFIAQSAHTRKEAMNSLEGALARMLAGAASGVALNGLPADCKGTFLLMDEPFGGRPAYERLEVDAIVGNCAGCMQTYLFSSGGRWTVAGALSDSSQPFAYVEDPAEVPYDIDREGSSWMVPADASIGEGFEELQGAGWCVELKPDQLAQRAITVLQKAQEVCQTCKQVPSGEAQDLFEDDDLDGNIRDSETWTSYDDVPDATEEEKAIYSPVLWLFHQEGFPYLTGVRKLMALYQKSVPNMATKGFHRLVRADPVNAICNGFDSSAILYLQMFWQKHGHKKFEPMVKKTDAQLSQMSDKDRKAYERDWARCQVDADAAYTITDQTGALQDLQVDIPLPRLIADVTDNWKDDITGFMSPTGFIQQDVDASGLRVQRVGADLLAEPTEQDWSLWPGALRAFDDWRTGGKANLRTAGSAQKHNEALRRLLAVHGRGPAVVATERYYSVVGAEWGKQSVEADAVCAFMEFWEERGDAPLPNPSKGLLFAAKMPARWCVPSFAMVQKLRQTRRRLHLPMHWELELEPAFKVVDPDSGDLFTDEAALSTTLQERLEARRAEQQRKDAIAREWNLPPRFEVEFREDGTPYIVGPDMEEYSSPDDVPRPVWMRDSDGNRGGYGSSVRDTLQQRRHKQMMAAADAFNFKEASRLKEMMAADVPGPQTQVAKNRVESNADGEAAKEEQATTEGTGNGGAEPTRCRAGKMPVVKRTEQKDEKHSRKYTKNVGLKALQEKQIETGELCLLKNHWRLVGVRGSDGELVALDKAPDSVQDPANVVVVLAQFPADIVADEQDRVRKSWGLDDTWKVQVRIRITGNQITVWGPDGKSYMRQAQVARLQRQIEIRNRQRLQQAHSEDVLRLLPADGATPSDAFEVALGQSSGQCPIAPKLAGLYLPGSDAGTFVKLRTSPSSTTTVRATRQKGGVWEFVTITKSDDGAEETKKLAVSKGKAADKVPTGTFTVPDVSNKQIGVTVHPVSGENVLRRAVTLLSDAVGASCRICNPATGTTGKGKNGKLGTPGLKKEQQRSVYEATLRELSLRRQDAPRNLAAMTQHMLRKLFERRPQSADAIRRFFNRGSPAGKPSPFSVGKSRPIRLGTLCSGTDSPAIALKHLGLALQSLLSGSSKEFEVEHVFSCEFDPAKREFLLANFDFQYLFQDCTQMGRARAWDAKSQDVQNVPGDLDLLIAGFSCKDLSFMNSYRKTLEEMGQSGATLRGCLEYVERYRPRVVILENVYAIDRADQHGLKQVNIVMEGLRARGYAAGYALCNSCDYYVPQVRHRIWMWGYRIDATSPGLEPAEQEATRDRALQASLLVNPRVQELLRVLEEPCALHFEDLLLPEDHPAVQEFTSALCGRGAARGEGADMSKRNVKLTWQQKYTMHRAKLDYQQERPYTAERGARWKMMLNKRLLELLDLKCLDVLNEQGIDPREVPMLWDLLQSVERVPGTRVRRDRQNYATCVLPPSQLWHTVRHRFVLGQEKLALQGIFEEDLKNIRDFPQILLGDLAGNAFTSTVALANIVCAAVFADEAVSGATS